MTEDTSGGPGTESDPGTSSTIPAPGDPGAADTVLPPPPGVPTNIPGMPDTSGVDPAIIAAGVAAGVAAVAAAPVVAGVAAGVAAGAAAAAAAAFVLQTMSPPPEMLAETNENPDAPSKDTDGDGIEG